MSGALPPRDAAVGQDSWFALVRALVHDLRTPIATASGYLELVELDEPDLPLQHREYLTRAAIALREISSLTTVLMEVARLESGLRAPRLAEVDPSRLLERVVGRRRPLERAGIAVDAPREPDGRVLRCDAELVDRACDALLDLALARSPRDEKVILALRWNDAGGARLEVRDRGTPIDSDRLAQLFSHHGSRREGSSAARLGLVYCQLVGAAHGGGAGAERSVDGGMAFWIELPDDPEASAAG